MKVKIISLYLVCFLSIVMMNCQDITVGYLITEYASYSIDTMVVKKRP